MNPNIDNSLRKNSFDSFHTCRDGNISDNSVEDFIKERNNSESPKNNQLHKKIVHLEFLKLVYKKRDDCASFIVEESNDVVNLFLTTRLSNIL